MVSECQPNATANTALWKAVAQTAVLEFRTRTASLPAEVIDLTQSNERVASALRHVELTLIDALLPVVRHEVESGRLVLSDGDDYLSLSVNLARLCTNEWLSVGETA